MPRIARFVLPGVPHHVTQRGNRRGQVFFSDDDRRTYLSWMREYAMESGAEVVAYCLMPNHVHLVLVPATSESLHLTLRRLHQRYAQRINRLHGWHGHLWQGRYFASALDDPYFWAAIRYVELNPVRAGLVERAEAYPWSSARAHCGLQADAMLDVASSWQRRIAGVVHWGAFLRAGLKPEELEMLRRNAVMSLPCGAETFIDALEEQSGRCLRRREKGPRPRSRSGARQ